MHAGTERRNDGSLVVTRAVKSFIHKLCIPVLVDPLHAGHGVKEKMRESKMLFVTVGRGLSDCVHELQLHPTVIVLSIGMQKILIQSSACMCSECH